MEGSEMIRKDCNKKQEINLSNIIKISANNVASMKLNLWTEIQSENSAIS